MRSRLDDLIATAERQLAVRSYDAAIDTYRTALSEPGAAEARVAEKLQAAEAARGIVRPAEPPAPTEPPEVAMEPATVSALEPEPEPEPTPPPSFYLVEDDPARLEHPERGQGQLDVEPLSILDPTPIPDLPDPLFAARVAVAALIFLLVCGVVWLLK